MSAWWGQVVDGDCEGQLAAQGTTEHALLRWQFFGREIFILKTMMFHDITTVFNEGKHLKMVIRAVPESVSPILGPAKGLGLTALHSTI